MKRRLLDLLAPVRTVPAPDKGWRRLLKWAALPLTDRRWAAPMSAVAIGFGLFVGVAISPGAAGTLATGMPPVIEIPGLFAGDEEGGGEEFAKSGGEESSFPTESESESFESFGSEESFEGTEFGTEEEEPFEPVEEEEEPEEEEEAEVVEGVVVHANPAAGSYTLASSTGALSVVHAPKLPAPGTAISVPIETLANGTLAEAGTRERSGGKKKAKLEGIVTYVSSDPASPAYTVSKRGVSVLVHVHPDPSGAPPQLPVLGAFAIVTVDIERPAAAASASAEEPAPPGSGEPQPPAEPQAPAAPPAPVPPVMPPPAVPALPCAEAPAQPPQMPAPVSVLWQHSADADGVPFTYSDFAGVVMAICPSEGKLVLSADDLGESGAELILSVPAKIKTSKLKLGDSVLATADIGEGGALNLTGLASDERSVGADDAKAAQGDLVNHLSK
jgi:hypothetical protein